MYNYKMLDYFLISWCFKVANTFYSYPVVVYLLCTHVVSNENWNICYIGPTCFYWIIYVLKIFCLRKEKR